VLQVVSVEIAAGGAHVQSQSVGLDENSYNKPNHFVLDSVSQENHHRPVMVFVHAFEKRGGEPAFRALLVTEDGSLQMITHKQKVLWSRDESLSHIQELAFVTMPPKQWMDGDNKQGGSSGDRSSGVAVTFQQRLQMQVEGIIGGFGNLLELGFTTASKITDMESLVALFKGTGGARNGQRARGRGKDKFSFPGLVETVEHERRGTGTSVNIEARSRQEQFSIRRVAVAVTGLHTAVGLDSATGQVLWRVLLPQRREKTADNKDISRKVFVTHEKHLGKLGPEVIVTIDYGSVIDAIWIDAAFGEVTHTESLVLPGPCVQKMVVDVDTSVSSKKGLMVAAKSDSGTSSNTLDLYLLPSATARDMNVDSFVSGQTNVIRVLDRVNNVLSGYSMSTAESSKNSERVGTASQAWQIVLPAEESIVAVSTPPADEAINSPAESLGDDSVLVKYLNPHLVVVASMTDGANGDENQLTIHILDSISGRLLHRCSHDHAALPVEVDVSENWITYSYWNPKANRAEMSVLVMYEGHVDTFDLNIWSVPPQQSDEVNSAIPEGTGQSRAQMGRMRPPRKRRRGRKRVLEEEAVDNIAPAISWMGGVPKDANGVHPFSSFDAIKPLVLQRSYIFPQAVKALSTTQTARGISEKRLLVGLSSNQIYRLDRNFLNPRRPTIKPTPSEMKEGLMQYSPFLPIIPQRVLSYNQTIESLHEIRSVPAAAGGLESTSLIFGVGLDLFYARIVPSNRFDLLAEDFNHPLLVLLTGGLGVGTLMMKWSLQAKKLSDQWQ
jgi:hypothetical protein